MKSSVESKSVQTAEAGHWGKDVRSDLDVAIEPREGGGVEITVEARVAPYYGDSIQAQARQVLESLGVKHARVAIHDEGALPFVISARIETAVRRAGLAGEGARATQAEQKALPQRFALPEASARDRLRRSRLYLPGTEATDFINAGLHRPDAIILDLQDAVHHGEKDAARILVRNTLRAVDFGGCERMVRINQVPMGRGDPAEIVPAAPDLVLIPKIEDADQEREV